jgi:transcriptional regulator with XRE-family HTH domain
MSITKLSELNLLKDRLIHLRGSRKKAEFARFIGVSPPLYHQWEAGSKPTYDKAALIARVCNVSLEWLLNGSSSPPAASQVMSKNTRIDGPADCKRCGDKDAELDVLRIELRDARSVIRDQASALAAALRQNRNQKL